MKPLLLFTIFLLCGTGSAQEVNNSGDVISKVIESGSYGGGADKLLSRMGDAAAVQVVKIVAGKKLNSHEIDGVLIVLQLAFSDPKLVATATDRQPRAAAFVLQYLGLLASESDLQTRISQVQVSIARKTIPRPD